MSLHSLFINEETREEMEQKVAETLKNLPPAGFGTTFTSKRFDPGTGRWIARGYWYDPD